MCVYNFSYYVTFNSHMFEWVSIYKQLINMHYAQVLTGEFTFGDGTMLAPPPKNPQVDPNVTFDATVDNVADPSIFVIYQDAQNYPAYMVNYK